MKLPNFLTEIFNPAPDDETEPLQRTPLEELQLKFNHARVAQSAAMRRIAAFHRDHPELWQQYFTRAGESERKRAAHEST